MKKLMLLAMFALSTLQCLAQQLTLSNTSDCYLIVRVHAMNLTPTPTCAANHSSAAAISSWIVLAPSSSYIATVGDLTTTPSGTWLWYAADISDATRLGGSYNCGGCQTTVLTDCNPNTTNATFFRITNPTCTGISSMGWTNMNSCNDPNCDVNICVAGICRGFRWTNSGTNATLSM